MSIARALAPRPSVVVLDEAVSALDVTIQAQILDLLAHLQHTTGVSYLFISHDLGVISHVSDRILVMKDGAVVEQGTPHEIFGSPQHPYTRQLVASIPEFDPASFAGAPPEPADPRPIEAAADARPGSSIRPRPTTEVLS